MATISAITSTSSIVCAPLLHKPSSYLSSSPVLGLPAMARKSGFRVSCSMGTKGSNETSKVGMGASLLAAVSAATMSSLPAMALVDERMSTEGTELPFGLSNNLLGWILLGVFGLIWSLYTVYTSGLDEDEVSRANCRRPDLARKGRYWRIGVNTRKEFSRKT